MKSWTIEFHYRAKNDLDKLDKPTAVRILKFLHDRVLKLDDPKKLAKPLRGKLATHWRYRVGDYRIICDIVESRILILVLYISHRKESYR